MNSKIKLVQVIADGNLGGGPAHVLGLLKHIDKSLFECHLICPLGDLARQARDIPGVTVETSLMRSKFDFFAVRKINKIICQIQASGNPFAPIIVHTHGPRAGLLGRWATPKGAFSVYTEHRWDSDYHLESIVNEYLQLSLLKRLNHRTNLVIAVSNAVKDFLIYKKLAPPARIALIPNAIEINGSCQRPRSKSKQANHFVIGNVGNLNLQKGQSYLIEAMPEVIRRYPHAMLEIIGDGEERKNLELKIQALGLGRHVTLLGKQNDPMGHMAKWDLLVSSSIAETFGIVILEAFVCGLPVVATAVGGVKDVIKDRKHGLLVPSSNPKALANGIVELLDHPALAEKLARAGRERAKDYDWKVVVKKIEKVYEGLIR